MTWSGRLGTFAHEHEEGLLYLLAAVLYVVPCLFVRRLILNWITGPLFPVLIVGVIPQLVRNRRARSATSETR
jgi:hypothetical protein